MRISPDFADSSSPRHPRRRLGQIALNPRTIIMVLFVPSPESVGSPEGEERPESPPLDKGKGKALVPVTEQGEITGVSCDLCERKGIPCRWGKVSSAFFFFFDVY